MGKRALLAVVIVFGLGACNPNAPHCLPAPAAPVKCPPGVFIDSSRGDPTCMDGASGDLICRGAASSCYVCDGPRFTDGCTSNSVGTYECVHSCSRC